MRDSTALGTATLGMAVFFGHGIAAALDGTLVRGEAGTVRFIDRAANHPAEPRHRATHDRSPPAGEPQGGHEPAPLAGRPSRCERADNTSELTTVHCVDEEG